MSNRKKYLVFGLIIVLGVALDQITKVWAADTLKDVYDYNPDAFFAWTYAENDGAFLSLGSNLPDGLRLILLTILPGLLLLGVMVYMLRSKALTMAENVCFALIAAGGIGNIIDRIMYGKVVDFMHMNFGVMETGIFNVADLYIVFGIIIYVLAYFMGPKQPPESTDATPAT
ncbi:MAG: signal peptidase II [Bacteroidota bacterium]